MQAARQREAWSANINRFTNEMAQRMQMLTNAPKPTSPQENNGFNPYRSPGIGAVPTAVSMSRQIAGSLIGYASETTRNQIKFGDKNAKKQLDVLEEIRDNTANISDRAETFE